MTSPIPLSLLDRVGFQIVISTPWTPLFRSLHGRPRPGKGKCEVVTRAPRTAVSPPCGSPRIAREPSLMDTAKPRTIFITGATGLVGGHAAEEALRRGHSLRAL